LGIAFPIIIPLHRGSEQPPTVAIASELHLQVWKPLGTCAGFYAAQYLKTGSLPAHGLEVQVTAEKAAHPARLARFRIEVNVPALDPRHEEGILRAVKACLIHHTLLNAPEIETVVNASAEVHAG
jgi:putative redox protein